MNFNITLLYRINLHYSNKYSWAHIKLNIQIHDENEIKWGKKGMNF